jgi:muconolactone delta-isomerase
MQFLVTGEFDMSRVPADPEQMAAVSEMVTIPSLEMVAAWEKEGRVLAGGIHAGSSKTAYIVEAASIEELSDLLQSMPAWTFMTIDATPLESTEHRISQIRARVERLKVLVRH